MHARLGLVLAAERGLPAARLNLFGKIRVGDRAEISVVGPKRVDRWKWVVSGKWVESGRTAVVGPERVYRGRIAVV